MNDNVLLVLEFDSGDYNRSEIFKQNFLQKPNFG